MMTKVSAPLGMGSKESSRSERSETARECCSASRTQFAQLELQFALRNTARCVNSWVLISLLSKTQALLRPRRESWTDSPRTFEEEEFLRGTSGLKSTVTSRRIISRPLEYVQGLANSAKSSDSVYEGSHLIPLPLWRGQPNAFPLHFGQRISFQTHWLSCSIEALRSTDRKHPWITERDHGPFPLLAPLAR